MSRKTEEYLIDDLNEAGQEGWELVSIEYRRDPGGMGESMIWTAFVKRPHSGERSVELKQKHIVDDEVAKKQQFLAAQLDDAEMEFKFQDEVEQPQVTSDESDLQIQALDDGLKLEDELKLEGDDGGELKLEGDDESELKLRDEVAEAEVIDAEDAGERDDKG
jgi:hypothetical protein